MDYLTTHTSLSPIRCGFASGFVNYKERCTRLAAARHKVYQLLVHGRWFSPGIPASSTTKHGRHDIGEILLIVALNTKNHSIFPRNYRSKNMQEAINILYECNCYSQNIHNSESYPSKNAKETNFKIRVITALKTFKRWFSNIDEITILNLQNTLPICKYIVL